MVQILTKLADTLWHIYIYVSKLFRDSSSTFPHERLFCVTAFQVIFLILGVDSKECLHFKKEKGRQGGSTSTLREL